jgi:hypothetical protein
VRGGSFGYNGDDNRDLRCVDDGGFLARDFPWLFMGFRCCSDP